MFGRSKSAASLGLASDHSTGGAIIGGSLRAAGFSGGIVRYAAAGRGNVNISPAEYADLKVNNIPVGIVLEHEANWLLNTGTVAGRVQASQNICRQAGIPDGVIYMAVDFDVTEGGPTSPGSPGDQNMQAVSRGLGIASNVIGRKNVGFYGSAYAIDWLLAHGWNDIYFWDTEAWSHGRPPHPAAHLYQRAAAANVHGVQVDIDLILKKDWGQRVAPKPPPPPPPVTHADGQFKFSGVYDHNARTVTVTDAKSKVKDWGNVNEVITLEVSLPVGNKPGRGRWTGRVSGKKPR